MQDVHNRISSSMNLDKGQKDASERVSSLERKLDAVVKEKDGLKRKCDNLEKEICTRCKNFELKCLFLKSFCKN